MSLLVTALNFTPKSWIAFSAATILIGLIYAASGALAGAVLEKLAATCLILFLALTDLGIAQNPMFGTGTPRWWASLLPGYDRRHTPARFGLGRTMSSRHDNPCTSGTRCYCSPCRCVECGDVVGVYEPLVAVLGGQEIHASLLAIDRSGALLDARSPGRESDRRELSCAARPEGAPTRVHGH